MRTLFDEGYAPITSSIGFLGVPLAQATRALVGWRRTLHEQVTTYEFECDLREALPRLLPLTTHRYPRELLTEVRTGWTAYFSCSALGTDAVSTIGALAELAACGGLVIDVGPHITTAGGKVERFGSVQFQMFGPDETHFLNYVRSVAVAHDGSKWVFISTGTPQPFEELEAYKRRRVRDRFTSEMLERYCQALGIDVFNPEAYGPRHVIVDSHLDLPPDALVLSLSDAQRRLGIVPGEAVRIPG